MILTPLFLIAAGGVRVTVAGEGKLRFAVGRKTLTAADATLAPNAQGLLADEAGRPVSPAIRVDSDAFRIAMNGTVTVSGRVVSRLVLERPGKGMVEIGYPGEDGFGIVQAASATTPDKPGRAPVVKPVVKTVKETIVSIVVRASNELSGDRVLLGDIADLTGDEATVARLSKVDIGTVPTLDSRRHLGVWTLTAAVRNAGFREGTYRLQAPTDVTIARKGQTVDTETMVGLATGKARALDGSDPILSVAPQPLRVPLGETTMSATAKRLGESDLVNVQIDVLVDGKPVGSRTVSFRAKLLGVRIGDALRVTVVLGGASVQTDAKAKTAGKLGGTIQITTPDGAVMTATVTGPGTAEVKL